MTDPYFTYVGGGEGRVFVGVMQYFRHILMGMKYFSKSLMAYKIFSYVLLPKFISKLATKEI